MRIASKFFKLVLLLSAVILLRSFLLTPPFEGTWQASGGDQEFAWDINYTFTWGTYSFEGYPPISGGGTYTIVSVEDDHYIVELNPYDEESGGSSLADFRVSEDGKTLDWGGSNYSRVK